MNYDLDYQAVVLAKPSEFNFECLDAIVAKSHGTSSMSDEDIKLTILHLREMAERQHKLINVLTKEVQDLKNQKSFIRRLFKK